MGLNLFEIHQVDSVFQRKRYLLAGGYRSVVGLKRLNPDLKVLISVAGWSTGESKFSRMVSSATRRQKFVKSIAKFLDTYNFDGVDLDWEFPGEFHYLQ